MRPLENRAISAETNAAMTESKQPLSGWQVRPLTRTRKDDGRVYSREPEVEAQVQEVSALGERARRERLLETGREWSDARRLREETLVYFLREYAMRDDETTAWEIIERLVDRVSAHVQRKLSRWRLTPEDADDCTRDLFAAMIEAVFDRSASAEFWEVRFWVCLDRRLWNLVEKRQAVADLEVSPGDQSSSDDEDEGGDRLFARIADTSPTAQSKIEQAEALSLLNENERRAVFLCYVEGLPEESEDPNKVSAAKILGVTGRSVRNYLRRAKEKLQAWERAALQA